MAVLGDEAIRYSSFNRYLRWRFGCRVHKVTLHAGFTCPNRDGKVGWGGCTFCNNAGFSPNVRVDAAGIRDQLGRGIESHRRKARRFIAYFQAYTNTYGPTDQLRSLYDEVWKFQEVCGLSVGTRPDCIDAGVVDLLAGYVDRGEVWVEYGLQSSFDRTLEIINRGHTYQQFLDAIELTRGRGLKICVHTILGLPGESREMMLETHRRLAALPIDGIKIHLLHIMRDTVMAGQYQAGEVSLLTREEFVERVVDVLELLPPEVVIQRMHADAPPTCWSRRSGAWTNRAYSMTSVASNSAAIPGRARPWASPWRICRMLRPTGPPRLDSRGFHPGKKVCI